MKIAFIPIDNRPICYDIIKDILSINSDIEFFIPDIKDMGGLVEGACIDNLFKFIEKLPEVDYFIVCLDTIAYGGLVPSRRIEDSFDKIKQRILKFKELVSSKCTKILAFSSIMRISNNNINEEEKEYWSSYGKKIFNWSYNSHKFNSDELPFDIPSEIIRDYLDTRKRNFEINKFYLDLAQEKFFDTLIFSKDDCAQYGFNIKEANILNNLIKEKKLSCAFIKTGADEIPLSLLTRALSYNKNIKINPVFIEDGSIDLISKYEDISIKDCVLSQILLANLNVDKNSSLTFLINNFKKEQGDWVLGDKINSIKKEIEFPKTPYFIADVNNANGADCNFIDELFRQNPNNLFSYCAYNTSANTIGCAILIAVVKYIALLNNSYNENAFKKIMFVRFLDDWVYQAIVRKNIRKKDPFYIEALKENIPLLNSHVQKISKFLNYYPQKIEYSLPWNRSFEIRIEIS